MEEKVGGGRGKFGNDYAGKFASHRYGEYDEDFEDEDGEN